MPSPYNNVFLAKETPDFAPLCATSQDSAGGSGKMRHFQEMPSILCKLVLAAYTSIYVPDPLGRTLNSNPKPCEITCTRNPKRWAKAQRP